jgi:hypothetical protein
MKTKIISVSYNFLGNPNNAKIQRKITKWQRKGYTLTHQQDNPPGCFFFPWTGSTRLTFTKQ